MFGPFSTASRRTPIHQVSPLSHARIDVHDDNNNDDNDNAWQRGPLWPHGMGPINNRLQLRTIFTSACCEKATTRPTCGRVECSGSWRGRRAAAREMRATCSPRPTPTSRPTPSSTSSPKSWLARATSWRPEPPRSSVSSRLVRSSLTVFLSFRQSYSLGYAKPPARVK